MTVENCLNLCLYQFNRPSVTFFFSSNVKTSQLDVQAFGLIWANGQLGLVKFFKC